MLKLTKKDAATPAAAAPVANTADTTNDDSSNGTAIGLGVAGLVLGAAGLVASLLAYRRATQAR
ncbi:hypothetical protein [Micromonospora sp. IBHARD004]|uniref:hypothetical protein n=1 Tax=Micromonospora sp. IBHARD004 TaxID=3457764 RepID=UPI0040596647